MTAKVMTQKVPKKSRDTYEEESMDSYSGETNPLMEQIINKVKQQFAVLACHILSGKLRIFLSILEC